MQNERIVKVHVRHGRHEPAAFLQVQVIFRGIRVHIGGEADVSSRIFRKNMDPILERKVVHPPVCSSAMVCHYVHYHFQPVFMSLSDKIPVQFIRAETRVDMVIVGAGIAVV